MALVAGLAIGIILQVGGCDRRSETAKAVENGSRDLHSLTGGGYAPAGPQAQATTYKKVAGAPGLATKGGNPGEQAAASILIAQAQAGLAEAEAAQTAAIERQARNGMTAVNSHVGQYSLHTAVAAAAHGFDTSKELAEIAASKLDKDTMAASERERLAVIQKQVNDLRAQAKIRIDAADKAEAEYTRLMQSALQLSATDASPIVAQANTHKRESDVNRLAGSKLEAQADEVAPLITEITAMIDQLTNQKKNLEQSETTLAVHADAARAEAKAAEAAAHAAAVEIDKGVLAIDKLRAGELEEAFGRATGLFNKAVAAAKDAAGVSPAAGKVALGDAQQSMADMYWQRAQGLRAYALFLESLSAVQPPLPNAPDYTKKAADARTQEKEALENATQRLEAAKSAFASAQVKGDAKEGLQALSAMLEASMGVVAGNATDLSPPAPAAAAPETAPGATEPTAVAAVDPALPALVDSFVKAVQENRYADLGAMMYAPTPELRQALSSLMAVGGQSARADAACKAKFGLGLDGILATVPGIGAAISQQLAASKQGFSAETMRNLKSSDLTFAVSGDKATASGSTLPSPLQFTKAEGQWYIYDPAMAAAGPQLAMAAKMVGPMGTVMEEFAVAVEAGQYPDAAAAAQGFMAKFQPIMMQIMQQLQPGTKPPAGGGG